MRKFIDNEDYQALIDRSIVVHSIKGVAIALLAFTGARANEILKLTHDSFFLKKSTNGVSVHIKASKNGRDRWIKLPVELYNPIAHVVELLKENETPLFGLISRGTLTIFSAYQRIRRFFIAIQLELFGGQKYTLHSLRHSMAIRALKSGWDIIKVKATLGHKSINATMFYLAEYEQGLVLDNVADLVRSDV